MRRYYADLVIASLQDNAYAALTGSEELLEYPSLFAGLTRLPRPMLNENWDFDGECLTGELLRQAMVPQLSNVRNSKPLSQLLLLCSWLPGPCCTCFVDASVSHDL